MRRKLNIIIAVVFIIINVVACNKEPVEYISDYADDNIGKEADDMQTDITAEEEGCGSESISEEDTASFLDAAEKVPIHVCGAVNSPGLYYMSPDSLKADALAMAGGFAPDAATDYVNLAQMIVYGEKIYFPYIYELEVGYNLEGYEENQTTNLININTATKDELMTLPGIGESKAEAIIKYRDNNGPFQSTEDITNIPGIKEGVYNNIKEHITVN